MLNRKRWLRSGAAALAAFGLAAAPAAQAGGFSIFEGSAKGTALGGAMVAGVDDPSAMFYNPAALTQFDALEGQLGAVLIYPTNSKLLNGSNPYPGAGYSAKQKDLVFGLPQFYVVAPVTKDFKVALGSWVPFGLSTAWDGPDTFAGRFLSQRVDLRQFAVGLQGAYRLADFVSIGGGPELRIGDVKLQRNVPLFNPYTSRVVDAAHVDIVSDGFEVKVTWSAGILITPMKGLKVGVNHRAHVDVDYEGDAVFYQLTTGYADLDAALRSRLPTDRPVPVQTSVQFPSVTMFGVSWQCLDRLTISADADYWSWKVFDQTVLRFGTVDGKTPPTSTLKHDYQNVWQFRGGANYKVSPKLDVSLGALYDNTPQPDSDVSPLLPDANRTGLSVGFGLKVGQKARLDVGNLFLFFHERTTNTNKDNFNATYRTRTNLFVLNFRTQI